MRAERTRSLLVRAGLSVFTERGYHKMRIADITTAAGVAVGTFYTYFDTKDEIFESVLELVENEVIATPNRPRGVGPAESIRSTNWLYMHSFARNARFWAVLEEAAMTSEVARTLILKRQRQNRRRTESALRRWIDAGLIEPMDNIPMVAQALGALTERCAYLWFVFGEVVDPEEAAERVTDIWFKMLRIDA